VRIRLHDAEGQSGVGEALPLPGYSRDDAETAERLLAALLGVVLEVPDSTSGGCLPRSHAGAAGEPARPITQRAFCAGVRLARPAGAPRRPKCGRLAGRRPRTAAGAGECAAARDDVTAAVAAARAAARRGHTVLKLKVARADRSAAQEHALLAAVRAAADAAAPGAVRLRLDANGAMDPATLVQRLSEWAAFGVELVEEPLAGSALLHMPGLPLPWAADESLDDPVLAAALLALPSGRGPAALVLKPALLGLVRCFELADAAAARGLGVIVTHSLDGDLGHAAACALALALPHAPWPCGLAAHPGLHRRVDPGVWLAAPVGLGLAVDSGD
jgi:L-alanine-DL-glutamate epimerase-like enolase superfamily enzyme